jgi:5-methylcytosine-specific restriction endonuclease McrA
MENMEQPKNDRVRQREWERRYRERHPGRARAYYVAHRDILAVKKRAYYLAHRAEALARQTAWRLAHPDYQRAYAASNRERMAAIENRHRSRAVNAPGSHTLQEWREKLELFAGCCVYCGRDDVPMTRDHRIPLERGGSDAISNILPACASCNSRKHTRTDVEFLAQRMAA